MGTTLCQTPETTDAEQRTSKLRFLLCWLVFILYMALGMVVESKIDNQPYCFRPASPCVPPNTERK